MVYQETIEIDTRGHGDMHDISSEVAEIVKRSEINTGIVHIFNVGNTAAIGTIEFEPGLAKDLPQIMDKLVPPGRSYFHEQAWHDGNGHSHLQATLLKESCTLPLTNRKIITGTWQQIYHLECDVKPRKRKIIVTVIGE